MFTKVRLQNLYLICNNRKTPEMNNQNQTLFYLLMDAMFPVPKKAVIIKNT